MDRIFLTGDTHADFGKLWRLHKQYNTTKDDIIIILGDSGLNYMSGGVARITKENLSRLPLTVVCIHGNHEQRPECIPTYNEIKWCEGVAMIEDKYPSLVFLKDGETYYINGKSFFVMGGAYSPDKEYRLAHNYPWYENEQPSENLKASVKAKLSQEKKNVDFVLTHTCPYSCIPFDSLQSNTGYEKIDYSTEFWLDEIKAMISYHCWYCGHYHIDLDSTDCRFLYDRVILL